MQSVTLNIRHDMPDSRWSALARVYEEMPGWQGYGADNCPVWSPDGPGLGDITASVEPSGLLFEVKLPESSWKRWLEEFIERATVAVRHPVEDADA